jgi:hypothetical protein
MWGRVPTSTHRPPRGGLDVPSTDASYKTVIGLATMAQLTGTQVVLRFRADGVNCASANEYRKDLIMISNNGYQGVP